MSHCPVTFYVPVPPTSTLTGPAGPAGPAGPPGPAGGYSLLGIVNIKDFGAVGDGVTDDTAAFLAFNTWAITQTRSVFLVIPPGNYAGLKLTLVGPTQSRGGADFYRGVKDLTIFAYGATLANIYRLSPLMLAQAGVFTTSARLAAVPLNSSTVTLLNSGDAANFAAGQWVMVSSLEMQGSQGFPPNWYYFDYAKILSISGTTVTFTAPLKFSHKSTYPVTVPAAQVPTVGFDCGGPASMFLMLQDWDQNLKIMGMSVLGTGGYQAGFSARRVELVDCDFSQSTQGVMVTNSREVIFQRCSTGRLLTDKIVSQLRVDNCRTTSLHFTTGSFDKVWVDGCDIDTVDNGLPKHTIIRNSNISLFTFAPSGFGAVESLILENNQIGNISWTYAFQSIALSLLTFFNGTFSMPLTATTANQVRFFAFAIPGAKCFFAQSGNSAMNMGNPFMITAVYEDTTNLYFDTTLTALPAYGGTLGVATHIVIHPCPRLTGRNVTGTDNATQLGKGTPGAPAWSYTHKIYAGDLVNPAQAIRQWGTFVSLKVNVIRADSGANATLSMNPLGQFGAYRYDNTNTWGQYNPRIDLKTAGVRTVTPTAVTGSAGADALGSAPGAIWFALNGLQPYLSVSISGNNATQMAVVEIELVTDQGITALEYNAL